jgi:hypothetical protein
MALLIRVENDSMRRTMTHHLTPRTGPANSDATRLFSKTSLSENDLGCWEFTGYLDQDGYGRFHYRGKCHGAHRVAYELAYGPVPAGLTVDHTCTNPACIRYEHLQAVTHAENCRRAAERRTHCKNGHEWNEANTYWYKGKRNCRRCNAEAVRRYAARRKSDPGSQDATRDF